MRTFLAALAVLSVCACPAFAEKRVALVIGNSAYRNVAPLDNPANDARLMAETLRDLGFTLVGDKAHLDLDKAGFDTAVQGFSDAVQGADVALFYYAGHGVQVRGSNYLVPVAANPTREADVFLQMVDTALVLSQMEGSGTKLNLVILDACRNNPFGGRGLRSTDSGLAQMRAPEGTLISFATQPGNVALDGREGNSPYTKALAATLRKPGLGIFDAFNEVGLAVKVATGGSQQPWTSSSPIAGRFYFKPPQVGEQNAVPLGPSAEEIAWTLVKDSRDAAQLRAFIAQFPAGVLRSSAEQRIAALAREAVAAREKQHELPSGTNADENAWNLVKNSRETWQLHNFIDQFPSSSFRSSAEQQIEVILREMGKERPQEPKTRKEPSALEKLHKMLERAQNAKGPLSKFAGIYATGVCGDDSIKMLHWSEGNKYFFSSSINPNFIVAYTVVPQKPISFKNGGAKFGSGASMPSYKLVPDDLKDETQTYAFLGDKIYYARGTGYSYMTKCAGELAERAAHYRRAYELAKQSPQPSSQSLVVPQSLE
jgi:uncharacterized caspase-like protein